MGITKKGVRKLPVFTLTPYLILLFGELGDEAHEAADLCLAFFHVSGGVGGVEFPRVGQGSGYQGTFVGRQIVGILVEMFFG